MGNAAEQLMLKHDGEMRRAIEDGRRIANRLMISLSSISVNKPAAFELLDVTEMQHEVQMLGERQMEFMAARKAAQQAAAEAME
jgi:hypothetical protein